MALQASLVGTCALPSYWLHDAVARGDTKLMKQLLADPAFPPNKPVQMPNGTIYIPLHVAIMAHNTAAEQLLLDAGGNPDAVNEVFREKYRKLKAEEAADKPRKCSFVELLVAEKADVSGVADVTLGTSWLHEVVRHRMPEEVAKALVKQGAPLDAGDGKGNTALHYTLEMENLHTCRMLLDIGANMNLYNKTGYTSFSCACMAGEASIVTYMISLGADVNGGSSKPLHLTCKGSPGKASYRNPDASADQVSAWMAAWAADKDGKRKAYLDIARQLLAHGADPQTGADDGSFPLLAAAEVGFVEVMQDLINADMYRAALAAISAIEAYAKKGAAADRDAAAAAAAAKAAASAPDAAGKARALQRVSASSLSKAAAAAQTDVKNIMTNVAPSLNKLCSGDSSTPLLVAALSGNVAAVEKLVALGAEPNLAAGDEQKPAIHAAAKKGLLDVVTKLVELGADWPHGKIAAVTGSDVVQLLVESYKGAKKLQHGREAADGSREARAAGALQAGRRSGSSSGSGA
ncbi:ankyrin repeat-containing domain protein [Scenedesmus sp. NREL 46B-D3]|nr:ankyrin repeat-containing domain protein [Scenedesmus sp. NREL 46B-D3]